MANLQEFISEYGDTTYTFNNLNFRKGAKITDHFGLSEGFQLDEENSMQWGFVRLHTGVDRAGGGFYKGVKDPVISPLNFERSAFIDLRGKVYGTEVLLFSEKYGFYFLIGHMFLEEILILNDLKEGKPIARDVLIGPAGTDGESTGRHTHTEVISIADKSDTLEELLFAKFGSVVGEEYDNDTIVQFYHSQEKFKTTSEHDILDDWSSQEKIRKASFSNRFFYHYTDANGHKKTRYSTELLFNGL